MQDSSVDADLESRMVSSIPSVMDVKKMFVAFIYLLGVVLRMVY